MITKPGIRIRRASVVCAVALFTGLAGCAGVGEPLSYVAADDIQPGPGMLTGNKGHFAVTVWKDDDKAAGPPRQAHGATRAVAVPAAPVQAPVRAQRRTLVSDRATTE